MSEKNQCRRNSPPRSRCPSTERKRWCENISLFTLPFIFWSPPSPSHWLNPTWIQKTRCWDVYSLHTTRRTREARSWGWGIEKMDNSPGFLKIVCKITCIMFPYKSVDLILWQYCIGEYCFSNPKVWFEISRDNFSKSHFTSNYSQGYLLPLGLFINYQRW